MTTANDSLLVDLGTGVAVASQLVGSLEYEAWIRADGLGELLGSRDVYVAAEQAAPLFPPGVQKLCALWNAVGSGKIIEILHYNVNMEDTVNDTASRGAIFVRMHRITAIPTGTTRTPVKYKSSSAALPAEITFYQHACSATPVGAPVGISAISINGGAAMSFGIRSLFDPRPIAEPLWLAEGEGIVVDQGDNNNVPTGGGQHLVFRVR